ncbi:MAG: helix-turn-helix domain-containing protein [Candidatus Heimdallarchaeota archaeon]|nr:helix-turn-helix domain-containing protein [Candidatus Heimdallarchaeota archaeon]
MEVPSISNIKLFREKIGWTQNQLADAVKVGQSYIARIEQGRHPSYDVLVRIFSVLREEFVKLEKNPPIAKHEATPRKKMRCLRLEDTLKDARILLQGVTQLPVIKKLNSATSNLEICVGTITSRLLVQYINEDLSETTLIREIMDPPLPTFSENTPIHQMREILHFIDAALLVDKGTITGIITKSDLI